eukprot:gene42001-55737_t
MRIDQLLVRRNMASTRSQAQRLIADGVEWLQGEAWKRIAKNGDEVPDAAQIRLLNDAQARYVSRGGLKLEHALQTVALVMFLPFDGLVPLYVISALFGLFQGGIVPTYAIIVREHFAPAQASVRVGAVIMATLVGMALGGWLSGWIFDITGSYHAAFVNGIGWNLLNLSITGWLFLRVRRNTQN